MKDTRLREWRCTEVCQRARTLYQKGLSSARIAGTLGMNGGVLYAHFTHYHKEILRHPYAQRREWRQHLAEWVRADYTLAEMGAKAGVSRERVRQVLLELGLARSGTRHHCREACHRVLEAPRPIAIRPLARETHLSEAQLRHAAQHHGIPTDPRRRKHVCDDRCARLKAALTECASIREAAAQAGVKPHWPSRMQIFHPDWPWPDPRWWLRRPA